MKAAQRTAATLSHGNAANKIIAQKKILDHISRCK